MTLQQPALLIAFSNERMEAVYLWGLPLVLMVVTGLIWYFKEQSLQRKAQEMRKQIAQDFHDELGSKLTIISMYSELIRREVPQDNELARHYLHKISRASNGLYLAMKDMLWTLDPTQDSLDDLLIKIKDFGEELFEDASADFSMQGIEMHASRVFLSLERKRHLLLLLKEGLNNALRHAEATRVNLSAKTNQSYLIIVLTDDGKGFDQTNNAEGEGIKNMQIRARKLNADFEIDSSEKGTTLTVKCPVY